MAPALLIDTDGVVALAGALRRAADDAGHLAGLATQACTSAVVVDGATVALRPLEERLALAAALLEDRARLAEALRWSPAGPAGLLALTAERTLASFRADRVAEAHLLLGDLLAHRGRALDAAGLARLRALLASLTPSETEEVVAAVPDDGWRAAFAKMRGRRGWSRPERLAFLSLLGRRLSAPTWRRLAALEPDLEPRLRDFSGDLPVRGDGTEPTFGLVEVTGPLAVPGPTGGPALAADDGVQGVLGDCSFWAALQALAHRHPDRLAERLEPNPNGTVTVRFADGLPVTVDPRTVGDVVRDFPVFAPDPPRPDTAGVQRELWPLVWHKAWVVRRGGYDEVADQDPAETAQALVGGEIVDLARRRLDAADLAARLAAGQVVFVEVFDVGEPSAAERAAATDGVGLRPRHGYWVVAADPAAGTVTLHNPWLAGEHLELAVAALRREEVGVRALTLDG